MPRIKSVLNVCLCHALLLSIWVFRAAMVHSQQATNRAHMTRGEEDCNEMRVGKDEDSMDLPHMLKFLNPISSSIGSLQLRLFDHIIKNLHITI